MTAASRFIVGLDLGTTNCALAVIDTEAKEGKAPVIESLPIPQLVKAGEVGERPLLPSFLYLPAEGEIAPAQIQVPWAKDRKFAVGTFARDHGAKIPTRLVASSKSWLCHPGVDRKGPVLPWTAEPDFPRISPVEAAVRLLDHLREVWNERRAGKNKALRLEQQEIVLTVPASFDAVARELTLEAAKQAGLERITLFEEPQAAFYSWLQGQGENWRKAVRPGDVVLVLDVGGGTTDLTLIGVSEAGGDLTLTRIAVGDHLLLGGDNMDLTLAYAVADQLKAQAPKLDANQMLGLWHACRTAKEKLFQSATAGPQPVAVLGRGSKVVGGTIKTQLERATVEKTLLDGFLPFVEWSAEPVRQRTVGLQEMGLAYAADAAISKHVAAFLRRHQEEIASFRSQQKGAPPPLPSGVLFNGGVFQAAPMQQRALEVMARWCKEQKAPECRALPAADLDQAVARGAAHYGWVRRGKGIRIRGGVARSYYIGVESAMPAVPGMPAPIKALCVVQKGMEEGTEVELPGREFALVVGEPAEFRFLGSTQREKDELGTLVADWEDTIEPVAPLTTTLTAGENAAEKIIPVRLHTKVTEIGTLEVWFQARDGRKWKLEFSVREPESA